jgi:hypothetical protein
MVGLNVSIKDEDNAVLAYSTKKIGLAMTSVQVSINKK